MANEERRNLVSLSDEDRGRIVGMVLANRPYKVVLLVEEIVKSAKAEAWDEGFTAGGDAEWGSNVEEIYPPNPYVEHG